MVEIKVRNCRSCPFYSWYYNDEGDEVYDCLAPAEIHSGNYDIKKWYEQNKSPRWCPLKKNSLKIEFKK